MRKPAKHRAQRPLSRKAKLIGAAAGLALVCAVTTISLAAGHGDENGDITAADYASTSPTAATAAAEQRLSDGDPAGAKVFATHALAGAPISIAALRSLGLAEQGLGHWQIAGALMSQSAALGWRDVPTQLWLAQAFQQQKDYSRASERLDSALRTNPQSTDIFNVLDQSIADPAFAKAMAERLKLNPNWRRSYFAYTTDVPDTALQARAMIIDDLARSAAPPSRDEIRPLLYALIGFRHAAQARQIWTRIEHVQAGSIYDPDFEHIATSATLPFEWAQLPVLGASLTIEPATEGTGNAVHVRTDGSASGILLRQWANLAPGRHALRYSASMPAAARNAFGWAIRCVPSGKTAFSSVGITSSPPYQFEVPGNCDTQMVELHAASSAAAANTKASFSGFHID